ncbi:MAG: response regulator [Epsilonproteobacteria bacterium]|nr:response regulator [Campylobacterota bacterium]
MKVLIVDGSSAMRRIIGKVLKNMGITEILQAADGVDAISLLSDTSVDLILADWNMPRMNGLRMVKKLREKKGTASIPIIMVTTEAERSSVVEAIKAGANNYLAKPFTPDALTKKIKETLHL